MPWLVKFVGQMVLWSAAASALDALLNQRDPVKDALTAARVAGVSSLVGASAIGIAETVTQGLRER